jgi:hypothetical protein
MPWQKPCHVFPKNSPLVLTIFGLYWGLAEVSCQYLSPKRYFLTNLFSYRPYLDILLKKGIPGFVALHPRMPLALPFYRHVAGTKKINRPCPNQKRILDMAYRISPKGTTNLITYLQMGIFELKNWRCAGEISRLAFESICPLRLTAWVNELLQGLMGGPACCLL